MERLEAKKVNGHVYYYYSEWGRKGGKCRRLRQKYLGSLKDMVAMVTGESNAPICAEVFAWGLPKALWEEVSRSDLTAVVNEVCPKRQQGLTTGEYLAIAALNRASQPCSKRSMWDWFSHTVLTRDIAQAKEDALTSQRFWDHMNRIGEQEAAEIWKRVFQGVIRREAVDPASISYDGTNFYTFIDTFNSRCEIARRGKNKQGRENLRQVSYALFCCADGPLPLYYDIYAGNRNDAKQFPVMLKKFQDFFQETAGAQCRAENVTLVFDKGNNSQDNFALLDTLELSYVGSVKLDEHKELALESNASDRFVPCLDQHLEGTKAFRIRKVVYGKERVLVVTYNPNLFAAQWKTVQSDMARAMEKLGQLAVKLDNRRLGLVTGGRKPAVEPVTRHVAGILSRQHMKDVIQTSIGTEGEDIRLRYAINPESVERLKDTYLGKNILVTDRQAWDNDKVIRAYRSQYLIEGIFKEMKDRSHGNWWPLYHWTDSKIRVHALYCTLALLFRGLMMRRLTRGGLRLSLQRVMRELEEIQEVKNIFPAQEKNGRGRRKAPLVQYVLTKMTETQEKIVSILGLSEKKPV